MTSATEELRRLLDERGVKWTYEYGIVCFSNEERWFKAWAYNDRLMCVSTGYYTPEQAIAAMLGTETCHMMYNELADISRCESCGWRANGKPTKFCPNCGRQVVSE